MSSILISVLSIVASTFFSSIPWLVTVLQLLPYILGLTSGDNNLFNSTGTDDGLADSAVYSLVDQGNSTGSNAGNAGEAVSPDTGASDTGGVGYESNIAEPSSDEQYVINAINKIRADNGLAALTVSPWIQYNIKKRLQYSLDRNDCDVAHTGKYLVFPPGFNEVATDTTTVESIAENWWSRGSQGHHDVLIDKYNGIKHKYIGVVVGHVPTTNSMYCAFAVLAPIAQPEE